MKNTNKQSKLKMLMILLSLAALPAQAFATCTQANRKKIAINEVKESLGQSPTSNYSVAEFDSPTNDAILIVVNDFKYTEDSWTSSPTRMASIVKIDKTTCAITESLGGHMLHGQ